VAPAVTATLLTTATDTETRPASKSVAPIASARGPAWAARESLVAAGFATPGDLTRWNEAFTALDAGEHRPTMFLGGFVAIGRRG
jgi:hypothetical protein